MKLALLLLWAFNAQASDDQAFLAKGHKLYYQGNLAAAFEAYDQAAKASSTTVEAWVNGAVVLEELGQRARAVQWYERATALTYDPAVMTALGWAQWRAGDLAAATTTFAVALQRQPDSTWALLGQGRIELDQGRAEEALRYFDKAESLTPLLNITAFYKAKAYEALHDTGKAVEAYKQTVVADSYFAEGRDALGRLYLRQRNYNEAWRQFSKILDLEPKNKKFLALVDRITPLLTSRPSQLRPTGLFLPIPYLADSESGGLVPLVKVGINTSPMGKPRPRPSMTFRVTSAFDVLAVNSGKRVAAGDAETVWQVRLHRVKKKRPVVALVDPSGKAVALHASGFAIRPQAAATGIVTLDPNTVGTGAAGKLLRGRVEMTLHKGGLRAVNILDLENYTHGVVSAEMPIKSPLEALKAQAVIARSHALYIKNVTRRHRRDGYDVCDEQHCQVYAGARAESQRSREVVDGTRGSIATFAGKVAHVIYSSNCGGHTQSGEDIGWGDVPYWLGVLDAPAEAAAPQTPWELRQWLSSWPSSFCRPSGDVHAAHFRWTRVMSFADLEEKLNRKLRTGKLKTIQAMRRSPSGNINRLMIVGSKRTIAVNHEIQIRGLLGLGSLRSTLFVIHFEYDAAGKPQTIVFQGAGWGHGVGLCQSGAMGRAEAGQTFGQIIKAYFPGTDLGQLQY